MMSPVESSPPVLSEGSEPDVPLGLAPFGVFVGATPPLCGSDVGPARRLVRRAGEVRVSTEVSDRK